MSPKMTGTHSGGLMYEYAMEENGYGIVGIGSGGSVKELEGFAKFASTLSANPALTGDGGAAKTTHSVACPTKDANWLVNSTLLPAIPEVAKQVSGFEK